MKFFRNRPSLVRFALIFAIVGLLSTIWALASPLMSVPDEQAHTIKAASVVRGELQGIPGQNQGDRAKVTVPAFVAASDGLPFCFAWKQAISAACSPKLPADTALVSAYTSAGNYNPMYYAVAGLPSLVMSGSKAIYAMRVVSGLLSAGFIAASFCCLASMQRRRLPLFVATFAVTPMVLFLSGSVNPNSLEVASAMATFSALCLAWERVALAGKWHLPLATAAVSAVALANSRPASLLWLALAVVASLLLFGLRPLRSVLREKFTWSMAAVVAIGCGLAIAWFKSADSLQNLVGQGIDASPARIISIMLDRTFYYAMGYVSYLGWLDTPGPAGVLALWAALIIGAVVAGLSVPSRPARLTIAFLVIALLALPPLLQVPLAKDVGLIWQGRYILALVVILIVACGLALRNLNVDFGKVGRRASVLLISAMVIGHLYSFAYGLRRYVIGLRDESSWSEMLTAPQWQPPFGWITLTVAYFVVLLAGAVLLHRTLAKPDKPVLDPEDAEDSVSAT